MALCVFRRKRTALVCLAGPSSRWEESGDESADGVGGRCSLTPMSHVVVVMEGRGGWEGGGRWRDPAIYAI